MVTLKYQKRKLKERCYSHWSEQENAQVEIFFEEFLTGKSLPGKKCIMDFKSRHPSISHAWGTIYSKIVNEKRTRQEQIARRLEQFK